MLQVRVCSGGVCNSCNEEQRARWRRLLCCALLSCPLTSLCLLSFCLLSSKWGFLVSGIRWNEFVCCLWGTLMNDIIAPVIHTNRIFMLLRRALVNPSFDTNARNTRPWINRFLTQFKEVCAFCRHRKETFFPPQRFNYFWCQIQIKLVTAGVRRFAFSVKNEIPSRNETFSTNHVCIKIIGDGFTQAVEEWVISPWWWIVR